ncbi:MAG: Ldh family oxidoreductase [Rhizobiales bacterium]|nr:Ldh family oxidoreductase [Hyphomicrobiales bacterium]MBI3673046.1 Ldh family oxidoreductase [Hyphomicrobiales bacterium]
MVGQDMRLSPKAARQLIHGVLTGAGLAPRNAGYFTDAILDTELSGLSGHGFFWLQFYCEHVKSGKVDGRARPQVKKTSPTAFMVDARGGFAHPAIEAGFTRLVPAAKKHGVAGMGIHNSYNAGTLGYHTGFLARQGLVAFGFTNSTPNIAPVGGRRKVIGTNPMSFAVPGRNGKIAFLIDQSSSAVTWTAVKRAAEEGREIPLGWALDAEGKPTTDPNKGLEGSMAPAGGHKGFGQGLIVEAMCACLAGGNRGLQMGSFTLNDGKPIGCGQFFLALDPGHFSGPVFDRQVTALAKSITAQEGARLPNSRRTANRKRLAKEGLSIDAALYERLKRFC